MSQGAADGPQEDMRPRQRSWFLALRVLAPWFVTIAFLATFEALYDFVPWTPPGVSEWLQEQMPEVTEMLVALAGLANVWIHWRRIANRPSGDRAARLYIEQ